MKNQALFCCFLAIFVVNIASGFDEDSDNWFTRIKRYTQSYEKEDKSSCRLDDCGYLTKKGKENFTNVTCDSNFVSNNSFPVTEKVITVSDAVLQEVTQLAQAILDGNCNKETVLNQIQAATVTCTPDAQITSASKTSNLLDIIYDLLAYKFNVGQFDVVKFSASLPSNVCVPVNASVGISELVRVLPPYCVLEDSKLKQKLPSPRVLALTVDQISREEGYEANTCLNSFGFFLFQSFASDVQELVAKSACGFECQKLSGCRASGDKALVGSLKSDDVDVMHVCSSSNATENSCLSYQKFQNLNSDCEVRRRGPLNKATPFVDLSDIYSKNTNVFANGLLPASSPSLSSTPLEVIHIVKTLSHNALAQIAKTQLPSLTNTQTFNYAKQVNTFIFQRILYEHLLPRLLGANATVQYYLNSTEGCYNSLNQVKVDVETVVVAFRYLNVYLPKEYLLLNKSYDVTAKKNLNEKTSSSEFYQQILRGLFVSKVYNDRDKSNTCPKKCKDNDFGSDHTLEQRTFDFHAARDVCVQPYVQYLAQLHNVSSRESWEYYKNFLPGCRTTKLAELYSCPQDLELAVGGALDIRYDSIFGDVFKNLIGSFFNELRCADPSFWTTQLTNNAAKTLLAGLDVQDWIACVAGLDKRPSNLFCPYGIDNPLVPVTCKSRDTMAALVKVV